MTFSIDNPRGGCNNPPLGKYVWEKPSGEQGLTLKWSRYSVLPLVVKRGPCGFLLRKVLSRINLAVKCGPLIKEPKYQKNENKK